jgi:hypothetical protein
MMQRCSALSAEVKSTVKLQARGRFTRMSHVRLHPHTISFLTNMLS